MKKFSILCFFILTSLFSCKEERYEKPDDLIGEEKMSDIVYDLSIFYAARGINFDKIKEQGLAPESFIYEKFEIDSAQFANSSVYYASKPNVYIKIYEKAQDRLNLYKDKLIKEANEREIKIDSLKKDLEGSSEAKDSLNINLEEVKN